MVRKGKEIRAARRAAQGVSAAVEIAPTTCQWSISQPQTERYAFIRSHLDDFFTYQTQDEANNIFPAGATSMEDLISPNHLLLGFSELSSFVNFYCTGSKGMLSATGEPCSNTVLSFWGSVFSYLHWKTGLDIPHKLYLEIRHYIQHDLAAYTTDIHRDLTWLEISDVKLLAKAYIDSNNSITTLEARICMLLWQSIAFQTSIRRCALVPSYKTRQQHRSLYFGDIEIRIILPEKDLPPQLFVHTLAVNSKNVSSQDADLILEQSDDIWGDPVHHLLVLAELRGYFPHNWTYAQMLDRDEVQKRLIPGMDHLRIRFPAISASQPIFASPPPYKNASAGLVSWTGKQLYRYMSQASLIAGFSQRLGPHDLRRSGATGLKIAGATDDEITEHLRQKWGGDTFKHYVGAIIVVDVTAAVHQMEHQVNELLPLHESRIKRTTVPPLPRHILQNILDNPKVVEAMENANDATKRFIKDLSIQNQADWCDFPEQLAIVQDLCEIARREYNARIWQARCTLYADKQESKPANHTSLLRTQSSLVEIQPDQWEDGGIEDATEQYDWNVAAEDYDAEDDSYFEGVDNLPAPETLGYNLHAFEKELNEQFILSHDLASPSAALANALEHGGLSHQQKDALVNAIQVDDLDPIIDPANIAEERLLDSSSSTGAQEAALLDDSAETELNDVFRDPLYPLQQALLVNDDRIGAFQAVKDLPADYFMLHSFRPLHRPINDQCPYCFESITNIIKNSKATSTATNRSLHPLLQTHINRCAALSTLDSTAPALLERYPMNINRDHIQGKARRRGNKTGVTGTGGATSVWKMHMVLAQALKKAVKKKEAIRCKDCPGKPIMYNVEFAKEHLLVVHNQWIGPKGSTAQLKEVRMREEWSAVSAGFPLAPYSTHDSRYHPDPGEYARFCETMYMERIQQTCEANVTGYGVYPQLEYEDIRLPEMDNDIKQDDKYRKISTRGELVVQDALCILCVNNPHLCWTERCSSHNQDAHQRQCLHRNLNLLLELDRTAENGDEILLTTAQWLWTPMGYKCPDPWCYQQARRFRNVLDLVYHLAGVHMFLALYQKTHAKTLLKQITWADTKALLAWLEGPAEAAAAYQRKKASKGKSAVEAEEALESDQSMGGYNSAVDSD